MKKDEKPISVESNITPITRQPIQTIKANEWHKMTADELFNQLSILQGRMVIANQLGNHPLYQQLEFGVVQLNALIDKKTTQNEEQDVNS